MDLIDALNDQDSSEFLSMFVILRAYRCTCAILEKEISFDIFKYHYVHIHLHTDSCPDECIIHTENYSKAIELAAAALSRVQSIFICQGLNELEEKNKSSPNQAQP